MKKISKEDFQLELKSLLDQLDQQIHTHSTHMGTKNPGAGNKNRIEKLNVLKLQEFKVRDIQQCVAGFSEEEWKEQQAKMKATFDEASQALQMSDSI